MTIKTNSRVYWVVDTFFGLVNLALLVAIFTCNLEPLTKFGGAPMEGCLLGTLRDRVVVKKLNSERTTKGGIVIAETDRTQIVFGEVFSVGRGNLTSQGVYVPLEVKSGDHIVFHQGSANEILIEGESFFVLKENDILATVRKPAEAKSE